MKKNNRRGHEWENNIVNTAVSSVLSRRGSFCRSRWLSPFHMMGSSGNNDYWFLIHSTCRPYLSIYLYLFALYFHSVSQLTEKRNYFSGGKVGLFSWQKYTKVHYANNEKSCRCMQTKLWLSLTSIDQGQELIILLRGTELLPTTGIADTSPDNRSVDTIWYDTIGYLTCSKKLTGSQLSLPHGTNKKLKCETKNKIILISVHTIQCRWQ